MSVVPVKDKSVLVESVQVQSPDFIRRPYSSSAAGTETGSASPGNEESSSASVGKARPIHTRRKLPKGVILKSFDRDTYPLLLAVAVRIHCVIPVKERVLDVVSSQVQSPDFFAIV